LKRLCLIFPLLLVLACGHAIEPSVPAKDLAELVIRDSTYYAPETMVPYTGPVFSRFTLHPDQVQLEGRLQDGTWDGELRIYHRDGRIRYEGRFEHGERCGAWTENTDPRPQTNVLDELKDGIESLALYPPCSDER
jgi:hypothetical protein